ncbi:MAG TPA: DNA repair protein RecN [Bacteroidia bacterium]|jgi:DNA repair protein RecN (Recombination protein N)|nr:DNA repair protein RecN [Bacteroidia bacterium]
MLKRLLIKNYALLEEVTISLDDSLTVITGETGAGKSIMLGALGLVLGERADMAVLRDKQKKCIVEAIFRIETYSLENFFTDNELDYEKETTIRREIAPDGKSRAFVNDTPVTLQALKQLSQYLIDVHSQHETLLLNQASFRFNMVDAFANCIDERKQFAGFLSQLREKEKKLAELLAFEQQAKKDLDYYQFQFNELEQVNLQNGQLQTLEQEYDMLNNAEFIKQNLSRASDSIDGGDVNLLSHLASLKNILSQLTRYGKNYEELAARLQSVYVELKDIGAEVDSVNDAVVFDQQKLEEITWQLDLLNRLLKKHGVGDETELLKIRDEIGEKLQQFSSVEDEIKKLQTEIKKLGDTVWVKAKSLSEKRKKVIPAIQTSVQKMLASLSMPNAQLVINCNTLDTCNNYGSDELQFLFSANKGLALSELHKVASGGELSRLMLCLKSHLAEKTSLPTIIFDEIDTGVSGDVAHKIGSILLSMGKHMQVVAITHLPQIASKGKQHLFVYKQDIKDQTQSEIRSLNAEERVVEIAKMLSTGKPTEAAISNAKELLGSSN